jgi:ketosteroid isomerase-like protein
MLRALLALVCVAVYAAPAAAFPEFQKEFFAKYADGTDAAFTDLCKKEAKCFICHQGKKKDNRNAYGQALEEHIGKKDKKDVEKIVAALETVAAESSDPEVDGAPTYGELIAEGKLPGGSLEDAKKEPSAE